MTIKNYVVYSWLKEWVDNEISLTEYILNNVKRHRDKSSSPSSKAFHEENIKDIEEYISIIYQIKTNYKL